MTDTAMDKQSRVSRWVTLLTSLSQPKTGFMLLFGFAAGLPYALITGTIFAWFTAEEINTATIGVFSLVGLSYAFKFLWSPAVDRIDLPGLRGLGKRKQWIAPAQILLGVLIIVLSFLDPESQIGWFALLAALGAFVSATQDVVIDAWRVDVADEVATIDILSTIYQLGYRLASLAGGALALILADDIGWPAVFFWLGAAVFLIAVAGLFAPDASAAAPDEVGGDDPLIFLTQPGEIDRDTRGKAMIWIGALWGWALIVLAIFMIRSLGGFVRTIDSFTLGGYAIHPGWIFGLFDLGENGIPDAREFTLYMAPFIVLATVVAPAIIAARLHAMKESGHNVIPAYGEDGSVPPVQTTGARAADHLYRALVLPLTEMVGRLGSAMILILALVLTYRITDSIWGSFAYPFYLGELNHTLDEVAFASKIFGVGAILAGIAIGGVMLTTIGRMWTLLIGAVLAALTNLLYADLALGGAYMQAASDATGFTLLISTLAPFGSEALPRLTFTIMWENLAVGVAGTAFVAWLSSIVAKGYSAVQYALLSSLTMLVGTLGRGALGQMIEEQGYFYVFVLTTGIGFIAVILVLIEWWRESRGKEAAGIVAPEVLDRQLAE